MITKQFNSYKVNLVQSIEEFSYIKSLLSPDVHVGIDTETSGLDFNLDEIAGVCISLGKSYSPEHYQGFYFPLRHINYPNLPLKQVIDLVQFLVDNYTTVWWNRDFDFTFLEKEGFIAPCPGKSHDAQCMAHLVRCEPFPSLKQYTKDYLKFEVISYEDNKAVNNSFKTTDPTVSFIYASFDPIITALLARKLWSDYPYIRKIYPLDNTFAECMRRFMLSTNLYIDKELLQPMLEENKRQLIETQETIYHLAGYRFNIDSNVDKADVLSRFVTLTAKTSSGKYKVSKDILSTIDHPLAKLMVKYTNLRHFRNTYLEKMEAFPNPFKVNYHHCNAACLTKDNLVRTDGGIKSIASVEEGESIQTRFGWSTVIWTNKFEDEVIRVEFTNGTFIEGNRKHPVLLSDETWCGLGSLEVGQRVKINTDNSLVNTAVVLPELQHYSRANHIEFRREVDSELGYLLGFIDGYGLLVEDGIKICFNEFEPELESIVQLFSKRFNVKIPNRCVGTDHTIQYKFCSVELMRYFKSIGVKPHGFEKGVDVSQWPSEAQLNYVAGIFDTDGSVKKSGSNYNVVLVATSKGIIDNVATILRFHGIDCFLSVRSKDRKHPLCQIRVRGYVSVLKFIELVGSHMRCTHKVERLKEYQQIDYGRKSVWSKYQDTTKVKSIKVIGRREVYDIEVEGVHEFIANGIVTHNTGRLSSGTSSGNSYFAEFNIQNIPKVEIVRFLHKDNGLLSNDSQSSKQSLSYSLGYRLDDIEEEQFAGTVTTPSGEVSIESLLEGQVVLTPQGQATIESVEFLESDIIEIQSNGVILKVSPSSNVKILRDGQTIYCKACELLETDELAPVES